MSTDTLEIVAVHYERVNGTAIVTVILPDGRELIAIQDGHPLAAHTAYVTGIEQWTERELKPARSTDARLPSRIIRTLGKRKY